MPDSITHLNTVLSDRYRVDRELGAGASATVYLAWDLRHQRQVALKVLKPATAQRLNVERFAREIEIVAGLTHPHILPLHDSGEVDGVPFFVMPYIDGGTLRDRLSNDGALAPSEALLITTEMADALQTAHENGILHRDIKPENIMLTRGHALLVDFGIAGSGTPDPGATTSSGTPAYMSPEQAVGQGDPVAASDLYSLGCVFFEMLTGRPPYSSGTALGFVAAHLTAPTPVLREHGLDVSPEVQELLDSLLAKEPSERPQSAADLLRRLRRATVRAHGPAAPESGRPEVEEQILDLCASLAPGTVRTVLLEGEAGMGKSTVMNAVEARLAALGLPVLRGSATQSRQAAYQAWGTIMAGALQIGGITDVEARRDAATRMVAAEGDLEPLLPLLEQVLPMGLAESPFTAGMDGTSRAEATQELVAGILQRFGGGKTLVLLFDDVQWLDGASWSLILNSLPEAGTVVAILASRPGRAGVSTEVRELLDSDTTERIKLDSLDDEAIRRVAENAIGATPIGPALGRWLNARSDGNPYYAREIALALLEADDIAVLGGRVIKSPSEVDLKDLPLPATVEEWILSRVDRLPPEHRRVLTRASLLGRTFRVEELTVLQESDGTAGLSEILDDLVRAQLLVPDDGHFAFTHQITRDQVYLTLDEETRVTLHRRFAEWLEEGLSSDTAPRYTRLAHHWRRAGDPGKAVDYLGLASEAMLRQGAFGDAATCINRLVELDRRRGGAAGPLRQGHWNRTLSEAFNGLGQLFESAEHAAIALDQLGLRLPRTRLGWIALVLKNATTQALHLVRPPRKVGRGTEEHDRLFDLVISAAIQSEHRYRSNETLSYLGLILFATNMADRMQPTEGVAWAISPIAAVVSMGGLDKLAYRYLRYARSIADEATDPTGQARVAVVEGAIRFWSGDLEGAKKVIADGEEIARRFGLRKEATELSGIAVNICMAMGHYEEHRDRGLRLLDASGARGPNKSEIWGLTVLCQHTIRVGRLEEADVHLARLRAYATQLAHQDRVGYEAADLLLQLRREDWAQVRIATHRLSESLGIGSSDRTLIFSHWLSFLALSEGRLALLERAGEYDRASARTDAEKAIQAHLKFARTYAVATPHALLMKGRLLSLQGKTEPGCSALEQAREMATARSDPYAAARALHFRALAEPTNSQRDDWLATAAHEYEALGCRWHVGDVRRLRTGVMADELI